MKSPFAAESAETYSYPDPLKDKLSIDGIEEDNPLIDQEVMEDLAKPGADKPWVRIRIPRSKGDNDAIADYTQSIVQSGVNGDGTIVAQRLARGNQGIFGLLAEAWSFTGDKPTGSEYARLDRWAAVWIDACLSDALARGQEITAKKPPATSRPRKTSRAGSTVDSE